MSDYIYIVYTYRYQEMKSPKLDGFRRVFGDHRDLDFMPPTVIQWANVGAVNKREALAVAKTLPLYSVIRAWRSA